MNQCPNVFSMSKLKSKSSKCWKSNSVSKELSKSKLQSKISDIRLFFIKFKFEFIKFNDSWYTASSLTESMICYIFINLVALQSSSMFFSLTKRFVQKLYKMYTKFYKTLNCYKGQRLYKSKFCMIMNVQKMYFKFPHIYKKYTNCTKLVQS